MPSKSIVFLMASPMCSKSPKSSLDWRAYYIALIAFIQLECKLLGDKVSPGISSSSGFGESGAWV